MRFRKKPVEVEAVRWEGGSTAPLDAFLGQNWARADAKDVHWYLDSDEEQLVIWNAPEHGWIPCPVGHYIIRGVAGEFYPCEPDIFDATYEAVE